MNKDKLKEVLDERWRILTRDTNENGFDTH